MEGVCLSRPSHLAWILWTVGGCGVNLDISGAAVVCTSNADCPAGHQCKQPAGLCFSSDGETDAPELVDGEVSPDSGTVGTTLTATFEVNEPLRVDPVVTINTPAGPQFLFSSGANLEYTYTWAIDPGTPDGTYTVLAQLQDTAGNTADNLTVETVVIDTTPPQLAAAVQATPVFSGLGIVTLDVQVTEPLAATPDVQLLWPSSAAQISRSATFQSSSADGLTFTYAYDVQTSDESGSVSVQVDMVDIAGNAGTDQEPAVFELDTDAPSLTGVLLLEAPEASPPQIEVSAATHGTRVTVIVVTNEPLADIPMIAARGPMGASTPTTLPFNFLEEQGPRYTFELTFASIASGTTYDNGTYSIVGIADDLAGNTYDNSLVDAAGDVQFVVDTSIPLPPDTSTPGSILYRRAPWGDALADPRFSVESLRTGVTEGTGTVIAYRLEGANQVEVGRGASLGDGSFASFLLFPLDVHQIYLSFADAAGNESALTQVHDIELVATLGDSSTPNNSRVRGQPIFGDSLLTTRDFLVDPADLSKGGDGVATTSTPAAEWRRTSLRKTTDISPSRRYGHTMARDDARGRITLFGGCSDEDAAGTFVPLDDTWILSQGHWSPVVTLDPDLDGDPPPRCAHSTAYDPARDRMVMFGGFGNTGGLADTWEWDGSSWTLRDEGGGPSARTGAAMAFDPTSSRVLLYGGHTRADSQPNDETWAWDGIQWTQLFPTDPENDANPGAITLGAMAFDRTADLAVLVTPTMWGWTGVSWKRLADPPPDVRPDTLSAAYHDGRSQVVVRSCGLSWSYDGATWTEETGNALGTRASSAMAYDPGLQQLVTFGGQFSLVLPNPPPDFCLRSQTQGVDDTFALTAEWFRLEENAPEARSYHGAVYYDGTQEQQIVLFDGALEDGKTWGRTGLRWEDLNETGPAGRQGHNMVFDESANVIVMYGGYTGGTETWHYKWVPTTQPPWQYVWQQQCFPGTPCGDTGPTPPDLSDFGMAYDSARQVTVLFGGWGFDQLWEWDATNFIWEQRCDGDPATDTCSPGPGGRADHDMTYDSISGQVMLFGGFSEASACSASGECNDLWGWDGNDWILHNAHDATDPTLPMPRVAHRIAFDKARGAVMLFGGNVDYGSGLQCGTGSSVCGDTWMWDGSWTEIPTQSPSPRAKHTLTYDPHREVSVLFGGYEPDPIGFGFNDFGDTWELNAHTASRPAHIFDLGLEPSGLPGAGLCLTSPGSCPYQSLTMTWNAGAEGDDGNGTVSGAELYVWENGRWKATMVSNTLGNIPAGDALWTDGSAVLSWVVTDPGEIGRVLRGDSLALSAAATPIQAAGQSPSGGRISTDYVEVVVRYRD